MVIQSFRDRDTESLFFGERSRRFPGIQRVARRKLRELDAAHRLSDLAIFPGNRLEALKGDRAGKHSIRINERYRICFRWSEGQAYEVEIVDYH